jgi:hypothetical protein
MRFRFSDAAKRSLDSPEEKYGRGGEKKRREEK